MMNDYRAIFNQRLKPQSTSWLDIRAGLQHFAIVTYAVLKSSLESFVPSEYFEIPEFNINGKPMALMSAVPFVDVDFHFMRFPFVKFQFGQTNYRIYVIDKRTGDHVVWFFGTTLGSVLVAIPKFVWRIPWHYATYEVNCQYDHAQHRYTTFQSNVVSSWAAAQVELEDTGEPLGIVEGFETVDAVKLILTHPLVGYCRRSDNKLCSYSIWHEEINCTVGKPRNIYFGLFERLGLLSRQEMQQPHSIFISPLTTFNVTLPPNVCMNYQRQNRINLGYTSKKEVGMTYETIIAEINQLSTQERWALLETIVQSLRQEMGEPPIRKMVSAAEMRWIMKPTHDQIPTDEELKED